MLTLIRYGGFPIYFVLAFGAVALGTAARYAFAPTRTRRRFVEQMARATLFSTLAAVAADLATVGVNVNDRWDEWSRQLGRVLCQGVAESLSPAIIGFPLLALVALLVAVGSRSEAREVA